jgi:hypothetical protein
MRDRAARLHRDESGSTLIELTMSVPLMIITIMLSTAVLALIQARFGIQAAAREAGMVGSQVNTTIDPYDRQIAAAEETAERVLLEYGLELDRATITFDDTPTDLQRGALFHVQISYDVPLPSPSVTFWNRTFGLGPVFTVDSMSVLPIQKHKARWPCPSPDPICS